MSSHIRSIYSFHWKCDCRSPCSFLHGNGFGFGRSFFAKAHLQLLVLKKMVTKNKMAIIYLLFSFHNEQSSLLWVFWSQEHIFFHHHRHYIIACWKLKYKNEKRKIIIIHVPSTNRYRHVKRKQRETILKYSGKTFITGINKWFYFWVVFVHHVLSSVWDADVATVDFLKFYSHAESSVFDK